MDRELRLQAFIDAFLKNTLPYRWSSVIAVLGAGGMARFSMVESDQQLLPIHVAILTLTSFTLVVYQWDSIRELKTINNFTTNKTRTKRIMFVSFFFAITGCAIALTLLPEYLYKEMLIGCGLIVFYFLPLKIVRMTLDRYLVIRWIFLSFLIGGAALIVAGPANHHAFGLPLLIPMICGNLLVCDFRDRHEDGHNPNRTGFSGDKKKVGWQLFFLLALSLMALFAVSSIEDLQVLSWTIANFCGFGLLWLACCQERWPWRLTLLADFSLFFTAMVLGFSQSISV